MKKILLIPALLLAGNLMASDYLYEVTPLVGYNIAEGNLGLDDYAVFGAELQYNGLDSVIAPELSVFYSKADYDNFISQDTNVWRLALNGVYEFDQIGPVIPLAKAGVGYEYMGDTYDTKNTNSVFLDAGVGAKIPFTDSIALKLEAIYMNKYNSSDFDNNLMITAGLNIAFGAKTQSTPEDGDDDNDGVLNSVDECPTTPMGEKVDASGCAIDGDDDNDGVLNSIDECPTTPAGEKVNASGCPIDGDDDNDGVLNSVDKCPTTPAGEKVDATGCTIDGDDDNDGVLNSVDECPTTPAGNVVNDNGCTKRVNLHIKFENNSFEVDTESKIKVQKFADFLNTRTNFTTEIIGHTSSKGRASYNQSLSEKRAQAVKALLINDGVEENRIEAIGKGESEPMVEDSVVNADAQNRRIEAILIKQ